MRHLLISMFLIVLLTVIVSLALWHKQGEERVCNEVIVAISDSSHCQYIKKGEVLSILNKAGINPVKKKYGAIDTEKMELLLNKNGIIKQAECYRTTSGKIMVKVYQKEPLFRVFTSEGSYYIDKERNTMPLSPHHTPYVPVVSGAIKKEFAAKELYDFVSYIENSGIWSAQIDQIHVDGNEEITLIPKVGDQEILLGNLNDFELKLSNLLALYQEVFCKQGWGKYKRINLKFENQIVCTLR